VEGQSGGDSNPAPLPEGSVLRCYTTETGSTIISDLLAEGFDPQRHGTMRVESMVIEVDPSSSRGRPALC
jgi:hypothetical protein